MKKIIAFALLISLAFVVSGCKQTDKDARINDLEVRVSNLQTSIRDLKMENERLASELETAKARNKRDEVLIANLEKRIEELLKTIKEREAILANLYKQARVDIDKLVKELQSAGFNKPAAADTERTKHIGDGITLEKGADGKPTKLVIAGRVLFPSGEYKLSETGKKALLKIARILKDNVGTSNLRIDGHTDNVPVRQPNDKNLKDNEHLSALRAYTVYMFLVKSGGLDAKKVFFSGWGKNHPIASNETEEGRRKNRRVEILILPPDGPIVKPEK